MNYVKELLQNTIYLKN